MGGKKNIVFFGTPGLAAKILQQLNQSQNFTIVSVVTNPDAPQGRGQNLAASAVKTAAVTLDIPVLTPEKLDTDFLQTLTALDPDLFLVVAYGKIFPQEFLNLPKLGAFNLHFSLLPKYRGASPVQSAILNGETVSGLTIFELVQQMDAGPIFVQEKIDITEKNASTVFAEMTHQGAALLLKFSEDLCAGKTFTPEPQNEAAATYCQKFQKSHGQIFPSEETATEILKKYRAFFVWPQIFWIDPKTGKRTKFLDLRMYKNQEIPEDDVFIKTDNSCLLRTKNGFLEIVAAQPEGKQVMNGLDFWNWWKNED